MNGFEWLENLDFPEIDEQSLMTMRKFMVRLEAHNHRRRYTALAEDYRKHHRVIIDLLKICVEDAKLAGKDTLVVPVEAIETTVEYLSGDRKKSRGRPPATMKDRERSRRIAFRVAALAAELKKQGSTCAVPAATDLVAEELGLSFSMVEKMVYPRRRRRRQTMRKRLRP